MEEHFKRLEATLTQAVEQQIKITVNGKIDGLQADAIEIKNHLAKQDKTLEEHGDMIRSIDERVKPFEETVGTFSNIKKGIVWLAGLIIPMGVVVGGLKLLLNYLKQ